MFRAVFFKINHSWQSEKEFSLLDLHHLAPLSFVFSSGPNFQFVHDHKLTVLHMENKKQLITMWLILAKSSDI